MTNPRLARLERALLPTPPGPVYVFDPCFLPDVGRRGDHGDEDGGGAFILRPMSAKDRRRGPRPLPEPSPAEDELPAAVAKLKAKLKRLKGKDKRRP